MGPCVVTRHDIDPASDGEDETKAVYFADTDKGTRKKSNISRKGRKRKSDECTAPPMLHDAKRARVVIIDYGRSSSAPVHLDASSVPMPFSETSFESREETGKPLQKGDKLRIMIHPRIPEWTDTGSGDDDSSSQSDVAPASISPQPVPQMSPAPLEVQDQR